MSSRKVNAPRKPNCKVCQDAGKPETEWAHWPKDNKTGKTICPTLLAQDCRYCQKAGHTVKYCPKLAKDNADKERREKQSNKPEKKNQPQVQSQPQQKNNRFEILLDDDEDNEEIRNECKIMKKDQEYPQLCAPSKVKYTSNKATFSEMVSKPKEVYEEEKRTQDEERLIQAIQSGMVVLKQKPYTEAVKPKPTKRYVKWTDADDDSSSDEEDNDNIVSTDAW